MKKKIVIVDDFQESCELISEILSVEFECHFTCKSNEALGLIQKKRPDLIILDYKMPHVNGVELCKIIKEMPQLKNIPVVFVSGAVTSDERIETLESGGDDFLSKPYHPKELMLRVRKRLHRSFNVGDAEILTVENLKINLYTRQCYIENNEIKLTPKQFEILKLLIENRGQVISRHIFMTEVWGHHDVSVRNIDSQMNYLKKKIHGFRGSITSSSGFGYRLD